MNENTTEQICRTQLKLFREGILYHQMHTLEKLRSQVDNLSSHLKSAEKEQNKPKTIRRI